MTVLTEPVRNRIGKEVTNRLGLAISQGEIDNESAAECCDMLLTVIDTMTTVEEAMQFLQKLSNSWPFFGEILTKEQNTHDTISSIDQLFADRNNIQLIGGSLRG